MASQQQLQHLNISGLVSGLAAYAKASSGNGGADTNSSNTTGVGGMILVPASEVRFVLAGKQCVRRGGMMELRAVS